MTRGQAPQEGVQTSENKAPQSRILVFRQALVVS
jgi:hypothetical protein